MSTDFGKYLKKLRIDKEIVAKDMAAHLDVSVAYLCAVEMGRKNITNKLLNNIIRFYELSESEALQLFIVASKCKDTEIISLENLTLDLRHLVCIFALRIRNNSLSEDSLDKIQRILQPSSLL